MSQPKLPKSATATSTVIAESGSRQTAVWAIPVVHDPVGFEGVSVSETPGKKEAIPLAVSGNGAIARAKFMVGDGGLGFDDTAVKQFVDLLRPTQRELASQPSLVAILHRHQESILSMTPK